MSRRSYPRRQVVDTYRVGQYGNVKWHHTLECGHVEVRPRQSSAPQIGCAQCAQPTPPAMGGEDAALFDAELAARRARARLAERLAIDPSLIDAYPGPEGVAATVYLPPDVVRMLTL